MLNDTIFATSSGAPPAAIAIVRVSGPAAFAIAVVLAGRLPAARHATVRALRDPRGELLDRALLLVFPAPGTATGEDVVEFHVHGGRAVVAAVEAAIAEMPGVRRAIPGEFTRRALENGVIDLTAAEGIGDLLAAETETQRRAALRMAEGGLRIAVDGWTARLVGIAARIEAQLDFSDEDDVADEAIEAILEAAAAVSSEIDTILRQPPIERLRDGVRVVIAGPPNAGKSTLLNALVGRDAAIVASSSGTTRDRIDAPIARSGIAYVLTDTAGLTDTPNDAVERIGVSRAEDAIKGADILLWCGDEYDAVSGPSVVRVHPRADLPERHLAPLHADISVSAETCVGVEELWAIIESRAKALLPVVDAVATNQRQRALLHGCNIHLCAAIIAVDLLIIAEEVRLAVGELEAICGRGGIEDVLDALFLSFCIGK